MSENRPAALEGVKVLDLTDIKGQFCGKLLASLGAEVIKVEKPGGDAERMLPPFANNEPGLENSLWYASWNANKKSITLDIESKLGQEILKKLVKDADFLIESFNPGYMASLGLGYEDLEKINKNIIMTSITPFGQYGPYSQYKASDLTINAMACILYLIGDPKGSPVRISVPQAYTLGGAEGFGGSMIAYYARKSLGEGQHVDVCMRDAFLKTTITMLPDYEIGGRICHRGGVYWTIVRDPGNRCVWPCKDGSVTFRLHGGTFAAGTNRALYEWMNSEGYAPKALQELDWDHFDLDKVGQDTVDMFEDAIGDFFATKTRRELHEECYKKNIMLLPNLNIDEVTANAQLNSRDFFQEVEQFGKTVKYPGAFLKASETPVLPVEPMPKLGSFNEEVYINRLGYTAADLAAMAAEGII